jgi:nitrogenase molybdenum-cofactor synthesis protein NifE
MCEDDYSGRLYHYHLNESDIVVGSAVDRVKDQIFSLIESMENKPKLVSVLITCLDALLHTDYDVIGRELEKKYGIRFVVIKMFAFLNDSKTNHLMHLMKSVYSLLRFSGRRQENKINMIGNTAPFSMQSDFVKLLSNVGYEVQEIRTCKTYEEFEQMGDARLNVILNPNAVPAAEMMKEKIGIPYVNFFECMDPEMIRNNYRILEGALDCKLDYEPYYESAEKKAEEFACVIQGKQLAVGDGFDYNAVKCAAEFAELGGQIKYVLIQGVKKEDLPYYKRLKAKRQQTVFYPTKDYSFTYFKEEENYTADAAVGMMSLFLLGIFGPVHLMTGEEPFDFETFQETVDQMIDLLDTNDYPFEEKQETTIYDRDWGSYRERV